MSSSIKDVVEDAIEAIKKKYSTKVVMHGKIIEHVSVYKKKNIVRVFWGASAPDKAQEYILSKV